MPAAQMSPDPVTITIDEGVAFVTLHRPPLNVLDVHGLQQLNHILRRCESPPSGSFC